jgi:competence protein ComEC
MRFADFPFLRYLPFLVLGVLLSQDSPLIPVAPLASLIGIFWVLYAYLIFAKRKVTKLVPAALAYGMLFLLGVLLSENQKILRGESVDVKLGECDFYLARVEKYDVPKPNSLENLVDVIQIKDSTGWISSKGKVLVYHRGAAPLIPGQVILVKKSPEPIPPPLFPNEFDYSSFLARKEIHFRHFIGNDFRIVDSTAQGAPRFWLQRTRKHLAAVIDELVPNPESRQIAVALLLGQKETLDREIREAYAETGTMHILAVSGLHVGIIYAILLFPLKGIRTKARSRKLYLILVILLIWLYAVLTGFSPSVVRAATMFSLFTAGQMRERKPSSWNILAFSALLIISMDPAVIFEVGFQLSYLAVAGILLLQPIILKWWLPPNKILEYFWQITAVSLAAQLATFPLSILYFHIFPSYFLIANLVIIPLSFVVMNAGIVMLALSWVPWLGKVLGLSVSGLIWLQNWFTRVVQDLPGGNLERLTITFWGMLLIWVLLFVWANWEWGDRKSLIYLALVLFLLWSGDRLMREVSRPPAELLVFSGEKGVLLDFRAGGQHFSWNENLPPEQISFSIDPNRIAAHRPQFPESALAVREGKVLSFPLFGYQFEAGRNKFLWGGRRPLLIERVLPDGSCEPLPIDSLIANNGAFRVVF